MKPIVDRAAFAVIGALALALVSVLAGLADAGPLDPTTAPGPTDGVREAGTPISSLPFAATSAGRYYVTRNLSAGATTGIAISSSGVTIDLNGFEVNGSGAVAGSSGIYSTQIVREVTIKNGTVANWPASGITLNSESAIVHGVHISASQGGDGISLGRQSLVHDCVVWGSADDGIVVGIGSQVHHCTVRLSGGDEVQVVAETLVHHIVAEGSTSTTVGLGAGIYATSVANRIEDNIVRRNERGIDVDAGSNIVARNLAANNTDEYDVVAGNIFTESVAPSTDPWTNFDQ